MNFQNVAGWDRMIRILLGLGLLYLGWGGIVTGGVGTALIILGFVLLFTGLVGYCSLYSLFRIRTKKT
jgi:hypothetical protein